MPIPTPSVCFVDNNGSMNIYLDRTPAEIQVLITQFSHNGDCPSDWLYTGTPIPLTQEECQEDNDCWDCETMGNRICGPLTDTPTASIVGSTPSNSSGQLAFTGGDVAGLLGIGSAFLVGGSVLLMASKRRKVLSNVAVDGSYDGPRYPGDDF